MRTPKVCSFWGVLFMPSTDSVTLGSLFMVEAANLCLRKALVVLLYALPFGVLLPCGLQWRDIRQYGDECICGCGVEPSGSCSLSFGIFIARSGAYANGAVAGLGNYRVAKMVVCWHKYFYLISADNGRFFVCGEMRNKKNTTFVIA